MKCEAYAVSTKGEAYPVFGRRETYPVITKFEIYPVFTKREIILCILHCVHHYVNVKLTWCSTLNVKLILCSSNVGN